MYNLTLVCSCIMYDYSNIKVSRSYYRKRFKIRDISFRSSRRTGVYTAARLPTIELIKTVKLLSRRPQSFPHVLKRIINSGHESFEFASFKFAKLKRGVVDTSGTEFSEYSPTGKRRMRHARIIYVRARSAASTYDRAIAHGARAGAEQVRASPGQDWTAR